MKLQPELRSSAPLGNATAQPGATGTATDAQPASLKALADKVLERNRDRNSCAIDSDNPATRLATGSVASAGTAVECEGCRHMDMRKEYHDDTRRRFFWRCMKGHQILEAGYRGEWLRLAPPDCHDFEQYEPGAVH